MDQLTHFGRHNVIVLYQKEIFQNVVFFDCLRLLHNTVCTSAVTMCTLLTLVPASSFGGGLGVGARQVWVSCFYVRQTGQLPAEQDHPCASPISTHRTPGDSNQLSVKKG